MTPFYTDPAAVPRRREPSTAEAAALVDYPADHASCGRAVVDGVPCVKGHHTRPIISLYMYMYILIYSAKDRPDLDVFPASRLYMAFELRYG